MKKAILHIMFSCLFISPALASYTYEVYTYGGNETLIGTESILIDQQGGMDRLTLTQDSSGTILGTSTLGSGTGGIWQISLGDESNLDFSGGQVHQLDLNINATAVLTGGLIESIYSYQITTTPRGDPPQQVPNPHITLYHSGNVPTVQGIGGFDYLVGNWGDGTGFNIYLHDTGYDTYGNFDFILIPEPATLLLFLAGIPLLKKRSK